MTTPTFLAQARKEFHATLFQERILRVTDKGNWSNADGGMATSKGIAVGIARRLGVEVEGVQLAPQSAGREFEVICAEFLRKTITKLDHLRPGSWRVERISGDLAIAEYEQYAHLKAIDALVEDSKELRVALGRDYTVSPDVVIWREPVEDELINQQETLVDDSLARFAALRKKNNLLPLLHASISCKWTLRSDRAQNAVREALNLVRNRKGHLPHVVAVTAEPMPSRVASIAIGTGDIDCVYHFALPELQETVAELFEDNPRRYRLQAGHLQDLVGGNRLRDIADLPLDLVS